MSYGEWLGMMGLWREILGGINLLMVVFGYEEEARPLLTSKTEGLTVEGKKLVRHL
jgi:hypothetical protein